MKSIIRLVLLSLVLLMVALVSAITAMRFAIHGREVAVPKVVGMSPIDAERAAAADGLQLVVERQYYSPDIAEGKIMMQVPEPGTKVRRGWQVRVAASLGRQRVAIPDVKGDTSRAAEITIQRRGLDLASTATIPMAGIPADQVLAQSPPANASGVAAPRISLLLAAPANPPAFLMPNFVGQPLGTATQTLQSAGMRVGSVVIAAPPPDPGQAAGSPTPPTTTPPAPAPVPSPGSLILSQSPPAGQKITAGSPISFEVSK
jgi:beta-lactam-binding protein with PASTA domain